MRRNRFVSKSAEPFVAVGFSVAPVEIIAYLDLADAVYSEN